VLDTGKGMNAQKLADALLNAKNVVSSVYSEVPTYDRIVPILLEENGLNYLAEKCFLTPGVPVHPMLAHPSKGAISGFFCTLFILSFFGFFFLH
jgi:DNA ligase-1